MSPSHQARTYQDGIPHSTGDRDGLKISWPLWFLIGLGLCLAAGNVLWLQHHLLTIPPPWDQAFYLYMSLRYLHALADEGLLALVREFVHLSPDVAPLFPLTTLPLYLALGTSRLVAHLTNVYYLLLLLIGVYLLGVSMYGRTAAFLATLYIATFTAVVNFSRDYLLEFPAAVLATLGLYALLRADEFRQRPWCLLFGMLAGVALLTKTMTGVFFVGPVLYTLGRLIRRRQFDHERLSNGLLAMGVAVVVASAWWGPNFRSAFGYLIHFGFKEGSVPYSEGGSDLLTLKNLSYYPLALINHGTSFIYGLLFIGVIALRKLMRILQRGKGLPEEENSGKREGFLWAWLLVGYALLTVVPNKGAERYALPLLPPIALLLAGAIGSLHQPWIRHGLTATTLVVGAFNYVGLTYGLTGLPQAVYIPPFAVISHEYPHYQWVRSTLQLSPEILSPIPDVLSVISGLGPRGKQHIAAALRGSAFEPMPDDSIEAEVRGLYQAILGREPDDRGFQHYVDARKQGKITRKGLIDILLNSAEFKKSRVLRVLVVPDHPGFNASTLRYYAELYRFPLVFSHILDGPITQNRLREYHFALVKRGGYQGPEFSTGYNDQIAAALREPGSGFAPLPQSYAFPDGSDITIFAASSLFK